MTDIDFLFVTSVGYVCKEDIVLFLLKNGANPQSFDNFAIEAACRNSNYNVVKLLIDFGVDVRVKNDIALRSVVKNIHNDNTSIIDLLVKNGACITSNNHELLNQSVMFGCLNIFKYLIDNGEDILNIRTESLEFCIKNYIMIVIEYIYQNKLMADDEKYFEFYVMLNKMVANSTKK